MNILKSHGFRYFPKEDKILIDDIFCLHSNTYISLLYQIININMGIQYYYKFLNIFIFIFYFFTKKSY